MKNANRLFNNFVFFFLSGDREMLKDLHEKLMCDEQVSKFTLNQIRLSLFFILLSVYEIKGDLSVTGRD